MTNDRIQQKLKELPSLPGVYFHKNSDGEIIYVGKAAVLKNRVRQYFQSSRFQDQKTRMLISEIADIDWMTVDSELEALFLEAEMVRRYMPKYNILLRDDKSMVYIRIDYDSDYPTVTTTRRPLDDNAKYFGPYLSAYSVRQALRFLRRIFPFATNRGVGQKRANLHFHLGLDPGLEDNRTSIKDYRQNLRRLMAVIEGKKDDVARDLEKAMTKAAKQQDFELATIYRNQLTNLKRLNHQVIFSDKEFQDISKDHALNELVQLLGLKSFPARIEGYDISHMQGSDVVASMVVFSNGVSNKSQYRKFKTTINKNDDFYNMNETITRRLSEKNKKLWALPNILLIDGGKGQLDAALKARDSMGLNIPTIGLAKRFEQIIIDKNRSNISVNNEFIQKLGGFVEESENYQTINLPKSTNVIKLLQRIRDESHRFAVTYHSTLKRRASTKSLLDEIPSVGPVTRKKLLKKFGSIKGIKQSESSELEKLVGKQKADILRQYLE